jgi:glycosyltransferase involved in cell wall biosynthesis
VLKSGNKVAKAKKPDVIIVSSLSLLSILSGYYFSKKFNIKFILEIRDIWPLTAMELGGYSKWNPFILFLSWIEKLGYRNADVIVGTIPNLVEHVQNTVEKFQRCVCIPQGITKQQLNTFEKLPEEYIKKVFQRKAFRIAYTGTMNKANTIETLLEVAKNMGPDAGVDFYFLGKGDEKPKYVQKYGSFDHIHFLDAIPKNQVRDFLNNVDVTYDSFYGEMAKYGLSRNKWIDYMAASKPIICSFSGFQSLINDAKCGVFVPGNDQNALLKAIKEFKNLPSNELKEMGDNGRRYIETYRTFDKLSSEYELLFK